MTLHQFTSLPTSLAPAASAMYSPLLSAACRGRGWVVLLYAYFLVSVNLTLREDLWGAPTSKNSMSYNVIRKPN